MGTAAADSDNLMAILASPVGGRRSFRPRNLLLAQAGFRLQPLVLRVRFPGWQGR